MQNQLMSKELFDELGEGYGMDSIETLEKVERGFLTVNHVIAAGSQKYFLKRWRQEDTKKVLEVGAVEDHFSQHNVPVILPLKTLSDQTFLQTQSGIFSIYPFVQGRHIERRDVTGPSLQSLAEGLARIHNIGLWAPLEVTDQYKPWDRNKFFATAEEIEQKILALPERTEFDEMSLRILLRQRELLESERRHFVDFHLENDTLCHGDWTSDNVFFAADDTISRVFDLEKAEIAPRSAELVRSATYTFLDGSHSDQNIERAAKYIGVYAEKTGITVDEVRSGIEAWYIKDLHSLWIHREHYLVGSNRVDVFLKRKLEMLNFWPDNMEYILERLTCHINRQCAI